jgi:hypothetical protein
MHRKSLEAAEHIRKQDEIDVNDDQISTMISLNSPTEEENFDNKVDLKTKSLNSLHAKAKEYSLKLIEDSSKYAAKPDHVNSADYSGVDESSSSMFDE